jgi:Zn-dependent protease
LTVLTEIVAILWDITAALANFISGKRQRRFAHVIVVNAPRAVVWHMLRCKDITYEGLVPMHVMTEPMPGQPDHEVARVRFGQREMTMVTRIAKIVPEEVMILEVLAEGSDPAIVMGRDDYIGFFLADAGTGTKLGFSRELEPERWHAQVSVPLSLRSGARRYKATAERMAAAGDDGTGMVAASQLTPPAQTWSFGLTPNGLLLAVAALASFSYLWGWQQALLISAIIILHELGHALAMLIVGIPVKGVYLVPFFGGAAIAAAPYRNEGQSGFVALMGPGFSLLSTLALAVAAKETGNPIFKTAADISAIINLINLAPIYPLDGGRVLKTVLVSMSRMLAQIVGLAGAAAGFWIAWMFRDPLLGLFMLLGLLATLQIRKPSSVTPMRWPGALLLLLAFVATIAAYVAILYFGGSVRVGHGRT